jgi:hypothetical protein
MPDTRGVDMKIPGLRVLEKRWRDPRRERIRIDDDRLGVIRNEDRKRAAEKLPRGFAGLNRPRGRFLERRIYKSVPRADGREDPRAKPSPFTREQGQGEPAHPPRIDLQLLPGLAIRHRDRRCRAPKLQLQHRKPMPRRIRNRDTGAGEQLADFAQADALAQPPLNGVALGHAVAPGVASRTASARLERQQDIAKVLLGEHRAQLQSDAGPDSDVVTHGLGIQPHLSGDALLGRPAHPQPQHFLDFEHRDLAIHPWPPPPAPQRAETGSVYARSSRGERF